MRIDNPHNYQPEEMYLNSNVPTFALIGGIDKHRFPAVLVNSGEKVTVVYLLIMVDRGLIVQDI
jgi:hypothetical protein